MLAVGGAAAVAEQQQLAAAPDGIGANADQPGKGFRQGALGGVHGGPVLIEFGVVKGV